MDSNWKVDENGNSKLRKLYEPLMSFLAFAVLIIVILEVSIKLDPAVINLFSIIDTMVLVIFAFDYFFRFFKAKNKLKFIKSNIIDLIAIIPFSPVFRIARLAKLINLVKVFTINKVLAYLLRSSKKLDSFFKTNHFYLVLAIIVVIIVTGSVLISLIEGLDFGNAVWWSIVTFSTVGYGDISPKTAMGKVIAVILMFSGIGFIGVFTGTVATFFMKDKNKKVTFEMEIINKVKVRLDELDSISDEELETMFNTIRAVKNKSTFSDI